MTGPVIERRKLPPRRPVLEDLMQDAIDSVRTEVIADAVNDAMGLVETLPADLHVRTLHALRQRINARLGVAVKAAQPKRVQEPGLADVVFNPGAA